MQRAWVNNKLLITAGQFAKTTCQLFTKENRYCNIFKLARKIEITKILIHQLYKYVSRKIISGEKYYYLYLSVQKQILISDRRFLDAFLKHLMNRLNMI